MQWSGPFNASQGVNVRSNGTIKIFKIQKWKFPKRLIEINLSMAMWKQWKWTQHRFSSRNRQQIPGFSLHPLNHVYCKTSDHYWIIILRQDFIHIWKLIKFECLSLSPKFASTRVFRGNNSILARTSLWVRILENPFRNHETRKSKRILWDGGPDGHQSCALLPQELCHRFCSKTFDCLLDLPSRVISR